MILSEETKQQITAEYNSFKDHMYGGKTLKERKELDAFFTPPEITIQMIEKFDCDSLSSKNILDPTCGSGNLLAACIIAGADTDKVFGNDYDGKMVELCRKRLNDVCDLVSKPHINDLQIHQGNALHSFCLNVFDDNYEKCYFGDGKVVITTSKCRINRLDDNCNDERAWKYYKRYDKKASEEHFYKEEQRKLQEDFEREKSKHPVDENKTSLW